MLSHRCHMLVADHGVDRVAVAHRTHHAREPFVLRVLEALALESFEFDADRIVVAVEVTVPSQNPGAEGLRRIPRPVVTAEAEARAVPSAPNPISPKATSLGFGTGRSTTRSSPLAVKRASFPLRSTQLQTPPSASAVAPSGAPPRARWSANTRRALTVPAAPS